MGDRSDVHVHVYMDGDDMFRKPSHDLAAVWRAINSIEERQTMAQADIDALTAQVTQVATDIAAASAKLQTEIDALAAANPGVNLTALQAAVAPLDAAVVALGGLAPTPPAPPAA
jgi:hypothetical protein